MSDTPLKLAHDLCAQLAEKLAAATAQRDAMMKCCRSDGYACYKTEIEGLECTVENCPIMKGNVKQ